MRRSTALTTVIFALSCAALAAAAEPIFVPLPLADRVRTADSTRLDLGEPRLAFDGDFRTLLRTPALNPAWLRAEFDAPLTCEYLRMQFSGDVHTWSLAVADNLADLEARRGSYRVALADQRTGRDGRVELKLPAPLTLGAFQLELQRRTGDDYVHICEVQFCVPGTVEQLRVFAVTDRRQADVPAGRQEVSDVLRRPVHTVVWLKAQARATGGIELELAGQVQWAALTDGIVPWGDDAGQFLLTAPGAQRVRAALGEFTHEVTVIGTPRAIEKSPPDLEIFLIERLPRLDFDAPGGGLPVPGSSVTWRGHVFNWGPDAVAVRWAWLLDARPVAHGQATIPANQPPTAPTFIDLPWTWDPQRHDLELRITPVTALDELIIANNWLTVQTDAITVGFWVEQSLWDHHHAHQHRLPTRDANSFAGWAQRMMRQWNEMFAAAVYPEYPQGIVERVRLDRLVIVPDFALPLAGGLPSNNPDNRDKTVDLVWGHESGDLLLGGPLKPDHWWSPERAFDALTDGDVAARKVDPPFWCGLGYIHEMGHARYLIDAYGFNVHSGLGEDVSRRNILVTDEHGPILGRYMPLNADIQHWQKYEGQMGGDYWTYSLYEAMCWNRVAGHRARGGNCNSPSVIGEFLQEIPERLVYEFVDGGGRPLAHADVWVYRARGTGDGWYTKVYEDTPGVQARTDAAGRVVLDRTLWAADGVIRHGFGHSNAVALVRVTYAGRHYFLFEEVTDANLAYNLGQREECVFRRQIGLRDGDPRPEDWDPKARW